MGRLGVLVCWDQWYPEAARLMALAGAELLLYPTAIGWDPDDVQDEKTRQRDAWVLSHRGHAVANGLPVLSCNRVGHEASPLGASGIQFWGNSHVLGPQGEFLAEAGTEATVLLCDVDLQRSVRRIWPFLRDRRIDAYGDLLKRHRLSRSPRMAVLIRDAGPADIDAITAIYAVEVTDFVNTYEYDIPDATEMLRRMRDIVDRGFPGRRDRRPGRHAYANTYRTRVAYQWTVENSVYVDARFQGQGVGTGLLQALINACIARGYRQMVAVIGEPTNTASIKLHERFGFELVGVFRGLGRKHGRWLDTVQMQRALGDGADTAPSNE